LYREQGKTAEAVKIQQRIVQIKARGRGGDPQELADLAMLQFAQGRHTEAEALLRQVLAQQERTLGPDHLAVGKTVRQLAEVAADQNRDEQAAAFYRRALGVYEKTLGPSHPEVIRLTREYVTTLRRAHRDADADQLEARIKEGRK
jgi:tetratricopeptide (TPR) repeat protein